MQETRTSLFDDSGKLTGFTVVRGQLGSYPPIEDGAFNIVRMEPERPHPFLLLPVSSNVFRVQYSLPVAADDVSSVGCLENEDNEPLPWDGKAGWRPDGSFVLSPNLARKMRRLWLSQHSRFVLPGHASTDCIKAFCKAIYEETGWEPEIPC